MTSSVASERSTPPPWRRRLVAVLALVVVTAFATIVGAGFLGYVPPYLQGDWGCNDVGYPDPPPTYEELLTEHRESPYCARRVRDEEWW